MKKMFFITAILLFSIIIFSMPNADVLNKIHKKSTIGQYDISSAFKDSYAIASGMKGILELGGDFRGFAPSILKSIYSSLDGQTIQVISGRHSGSVFDGIYYTVSIDGGSIWSVPVLISDADSLLMCYSEITAPNGNYPYVSMNYITNYYSGVYFTKDSLGAGGGGWNAPILITDTASFNCDNPSIAVNKNGDKTAILSCDLTDGFGSTYSSDYGASWEEYSLQSALNSDTVSATDISCIRWASGDTVYGFFGITWKGEKRSNIAGGGPGTAVSNGYSVSTDGGNTWNQQQKSFYGNLTVPDINTLTGDTVIYYMDTIKGNFETDSALFYAYLDTLTGGWTNNLGESLGDGFGTWWYWWDAQCYLYYEKVSYFAVPVADLFIDYYVDSNDDMHTFIWQGQSLLFGIKDYNDSTFETFYIDLHDGEILDTIGRTATWRGNVTSANLCVDPSDSSIYVIYLDYVDTATGENSLEALKLEINYGDGDERSLSYDMQTLIPNISAYSVECSKYTDFDGYVHIAAASGTQDSIYYKKIQIGNEWYAGMESRFAENECFDEFFSISRVLTKRFGKFSFRISNSENIVIDVFDCSGRKIKNIVDSYFDKGEHKIDFSTGELNQGIYFINFKSDNFKTTKKLIIMK